MSRFNHCYAECRYAECHYAESRGAMSKGAPSNLCNKTFYDRNYCHIRLFATYSDSHSSLKFAGKDGSLTIKKEFTEELHSGRFILPTKDFSVKTD